MLMRREQNSERNAQSQLARLAAELRRGCDAIVRLWEGGASSPEGVSTEMLGPRIRDVPQVVEELARLVAAEGVASTDADGPMPPLAGSLRHSLAAWRRLRESILDVVTRLRRWTPDELIVLNGAIDALLLRHAGAAFDAGLDQARAADAAQAKFMSYLSHDLRGGLNGVVLMLEVIRRDLQPRPEFAESVQDLLLVRKSILDTVAVMERHLQVDRLRRGTVPMNSGPQDVHATVEEIAEAIRAEEQARDVGIVVEVPRESWVMADRDVLRLALRSLVENAVRHAGKQPVRITADRRDRGWAVAVIDAGPGIDPERLGKLVDPVRRSELKERGVGLMLAYHAAATMGGRLEAESQPGKGSTFRLVLPTA